MAKPVIQILMIEDNESDAILLEEILSKDTLNSFEITISERLETGLETLHRREFDLILLDLGLPDSQGLETFEKVHKKFPDLPLVVLSGLMDEGLALEAIQSGAQDYLVKGSAGWEIAPRAIRYAIERQQSQTALRESEAQYRLLFENAPIGILSVTVQGQITDVNAAALQILGSPSAEATKSINLLTFPPLIESGISADFQDCIENTRPVSAERPYTTKWGKSIIVKYQLTPVLNPAGKIILIQVIMEDITERKRAEETLRGSERQYRELFEMESDALFLIENQTGQILEVNSAASQLYGYSHEELLCLKNTDLSAEPEETQRVTQGTPIIVDNLVTIPLRWHRKKDGAVFPVEITGRFFLHDGRPVHIAAIRDITDRKQTEEALRESERLLNESQIIAGLGNYVLDIPTGIWKSSAVLDRVFGIDEAFDRSVEGWATLVHPDDRQQMVDYFTNEVIGKRVRFDKEYKIIRNNDKAERWVHGLGELEVDALNQLVRMHGTIQDITERKLAEKALRESEEKYRLLFENAPVGIFQSTPEGRYISVNSTLAHLFQYDSPREMTAQVIDIARQIHVDPAQRESFKNMLAEKGEVKEFVNQNYCKDGSIIWTSTNARAVKDELGNIQCYEGFMTDITERKQAEEAIRQSEKKFKTLFEIAPVGISVLDRGRNIIDANYSLERITGLNRDKLLEGAYRQRAYLRPDGTVMPPDEFASMRALRENLPIFDIETGIVTEDRGVVWTQVSAAPLDMPDASLVVITQDISERKQAEQALRQQLAELEMLYESGMALSQLLDPVQIGQKIIDLMAEKMDWDHTTIRLYNPEKDSLELLAFNQPGLTTEEEKRAAERRFRKLVNKPGVGLSGWVVQHGYPVRSGDVTNDPRYLDVVPGLHSGLYVPIQTGKKVLGVISIESEAPDAFSEADERLTKTLANQAATAFENARLFGEITQRLNELEALYTVSAAVRSAQTLDEALPLILNETLGALDTNAGMIKLYHPETDDLRDAVKRGWFHELDEFPIKPGEGIAGNVFASGEPRYSIEFKSDQQAYAPARNKIPDGWEGACLPIRVGPDSVGVILVAVPLPRQINSFQKKLLTSVAEIAGITIHRVKLYEDALTHLKHIQILQKIDRMITSSLDLRLSLRYLLSELVNMPEVDAANVMLLNPISLMLEFADSQGFTRKTIEELTLRPGEGTAGRAIMERIQIHISDPSQDMDKAHRKIFLEENFKSYHVQPLISKGRILGVLETYHRESPYAGNDWHEFLVAVADQAAIAIDNAQLLENLRRANDSLRLSYDATIEGWSNALDLRDKETEGHTQRVTTLTVDLARSMGISETNITHVRRGALLHDIGKMGVSDQILLKPGKLTDEEWEIMRQHPVHAYNLLSRIDFLRPALDIPRYHHERWDGAGYPDGLKGEQIPLTARIFAIVDVWDALTSDRPYRKAWSRKKALNYIIGQSGKYFDPKVVEKFIQLIQKAE